MTTPSLDCQIQTTSYGSVMYEYSTASPSDQMLLLVHLAGYAIIDADRRLYARTLLN